VPALAASTLRRAPILAIILVSYTMIVLDISIVITALPKIRGDLGFSATGLSWVQNAYTPAFGGLPLLGARTGDILVTVFAAAGSGAVDARELLARGVVTSLTAGTAMLALALVLVVALIARPARPRPPACASRAGA
jgi:hypothetical protein